MSILLTFIIGGIGGAIAFLLNFPVPWLVGSLLIMLVFKKARFIQAPTKSAARWMRVVLGVSLGCAVADSLKTFDFSLVALVGVCILFVCFLTLCGFFLFKRLPDFSKTDSFMSALPGGLTFLMSLSDDMGDKFPKIALIHTVRMVFLILCFSMMAYVIDVNGQGDAANQTINAAFNMPLEPLLWQVFAFVFVMGSIADKLKIAGGHIMFPLIAAAIFYSQGWIDTLVPEIFPTLAMITFGVTIGCKLNKVPFKAFKPYVGASLLFTVFAMGTAFAISLGLEGVLNMHYFLLFLALAPGSIAEISLIAMALGFDVGVVAVVHTCRYLFIMLIGASGLNLLSKPTKKTKPTPVNRQKIPA